MLSVKVVPGLPVEGVLELRKSETPPTRGWSWRVNGIVCIDQLAQWLTPLVAPPWPLEGLSDYQQDHREADPVWFPLTPWGLGAGATSVSSAPARGPERGLITTGEEKFLPPQPEGRSTPAGQAFPGEVGQAHLCIHLFVFLEKCASWRCEVWKAPSHLAEGTRKLECLRDLQTGMFPPRLRPTADSLGQHEAV